MKYNNNRYYEPEDGDFNEEAYLEALESALSSGGVYYWAEESNWYEALGQLEIEEDYEPNTAPQDVIDKVKAYWKEIAEEFTEGDF